MSRVYLPSTGAAYASPSFAAAWESTTAMDRVQAVLTKTSSAMTNKTTAGTGALGGTFDNGLRQYVLGPLAAGCVFTAGDVIKAQVRCLEASGTNNYVLVIQFRVMASDGTTLRAALRGLASATEFATSLTNRSVSSTVANSYTTVSGDMLVLEFGFRETASGQTGNGSINFGDDNGSDLPEDESTTTANNPWVEFPSTTLALSGGATAFPAAYYFNMMAG